MRKLVYIALLLALCLACTDRQTAWRLDRAQSLADSLPAEARGILDSLRPQLSGLSRSQLMRYHLTRIQADNLLDSTLHEDSLMRQVAEYYDDHGTANERMLAYYLLGRTYSDMGEAPQALQAFHDAIDHADTTSSDCDYRRLSRIYGQMASLFAHQFMPKRQKQALHHACRYALLSKDTLSYLIFRSKYTDYYKMSGLSDSVIINSKEVFDLAINNGYEDLAAASLSTVIYSELSQGKFEDAGKDMEIYEQKSGFWDKGDIVKGKELYYYFKGIYYIGTNHLDSAEHYFRKLQRTGSGFNDIHAAYEGLRKVYSVCGDKDSLAKYAELSADYNDSIFLENTSSTLERMQAMYNYDRSRAIADEMELKAEHSEKLSMFILLCFVVAIALMYATVLFYKKEKERRYENVKKELEYVISCHDYAKRELLSLMGQKESEYTSNIAKKQEEVELLKKKISEQSKKLGRISRVKLDRRLTETSVYRRFRDSIDNPSLKITAKEWHDLREMINREYPEFYARLVVGHSLKTEEYDTCILFRLHFKPSEIAALTFYKVASVSSQRRRMAKKILGYECSTDEFCDYLYKI